MPLPRFGVGVLVLAVVAGPICAAETTGVVAGWNREDGPVLLGELNCVACHASADAHPLLVKQSPILANVGSRITPQYLRAFLSDPQKVKAGTPMPDLLHALNAKEREETVEELVHYLVSLGGPIDQRSSGASLSQIERGKEIYHTAGCVACHEAYAPPPKHKVDPAFVNEDDPDKPKETKPPVPHGDLAMKTTVEQLAAFLSDPLKTRPSGRMPAVALQPGEAISLASYLLRDQYSDKEKAPGAGLDFAFYLGNYQTMPDFDKLKPVREGSVKGFDLDAAITPPRGRKPNSNFAVRFQGLIDIPEDGNYRFWTISDDGSILRIDGKIVVNNDGQHPPEEKTGQVNLKKGRHPIELGFTQGGGGFELSVLWQPPGAKARGPIPTGVLLHSAAAMIPKGEVAFTVDASKAERGRARFATLGCASCHATAADGKVEVAARLKAPALTALKTEAAGSCLADAVAAGRPRFALSDRQRTALRDAVATIQRGKLASDEASRIDRTMSALACYACHPRHGKGGPDAAKAPYFAYEVLVDLGDEGRLAPPLNDVGSKLTPVGFEDALFSGKRYRSYMATRMPNFGKVNIGHLPELFAKVDAGKVKPHTPGFSPRMVEDGRKLVGKNMLACVNCHAWGNFRLSGAEGLDLLQVTRRIRPDWFHQFVTAPQAMKPGTRMPQGWPDGKSFFTDVQGGDMHKQIDAIWAYLSAGDKGGLPPGLSPMDDSMLTPADGPIVFRTFLDGVSAHSILVGFPQRTHLAFDANRVRTAIAWTGDFVSTKAAWDGRAGQYAKVPSADVVRFPDGPTFAKLESLTSPWPKDEPKRNLGSNRTPPGWKFLGYRYDDKGVPTFESSYEGVRIEETPGTEVRADSAVLVRRFRLTSDQPVKEFYFRLARGQKIVESDGAFVVDDRVRYRLQPGEPKPFVRDADKEKEVVVPVQFVPAGKSHTAELVVEMVW